jgi:hypothetical protein
LVEALHKFRDAPVNSALLANRIGCGIKPALASLRLSVEKI